MKYRFSLISSFCAAALLSFNAHAAAPTKESIEKLMTVAHAEQVLDAMRPQVQAMTKQVMAQAMQGTDITPAEQKILDDFRAKAVAIINEELSMEKMKPMYLEIYSASLTQEDVDGLIAFYESPTGQVFVTKMPQIAQSILSQMPKQMAPMQQKMLQAAGEMQEQLAALKNKPAK
ncbi:DUF2059 domain-containing protein [Undibacterium sp. TJN25]|uniref:DUF2059 domain-containing protein n=1 Tax=Undibacterium sp. TJN25 TaxID=3413056 RepID=UPI003BF2F8A8